MLKNLHRPAWHIWKFQVAFLWKFWSHAAVYCRVYKSMKYPDMAFSALTSLTVHIGKPSFLVTVSTKTNSFLPFFSSFWTHLCGPLIFVGSSSWACNLSGIIFLVVYWAAHLSSKIIFNKILGNLCGRFSTICVDYLRLIFQGATQGCHASTHLFLHFETNPLPKTKKSMYTLICRVFNIFY